ncbi:hypothetical protein Plo01_61210 [Planobispora longispora]|uniref:Uncharacterized protein n=1 Tax=Planobispora longispora TaxID=28887 RepID=A0A8J3RTQ4_9ACTN|nr:hypothetical protein Plo01_61210 [Planobispora longispora]
METVTSSGARNADATMAWRAKASAPDPGVSRFVMASGCAAPDRPGNGAFPRKGGGFPRGPERLSPGRGAALPGRGGTPAGP